MASKKILVHTNTIQADGSKDRYVQQPGDGADLEEFGPQRLEYAYTSLFQL